MEQWTGERFYLCASGRQDGRDMSTAGWGHNWIAVEAKRYGKNTPLNQRELLGEFLQLSRRISGLDLWIVVSSTPAAEQLVTEINEATAAAGVECLILDPAPGGGLLLPFVLKFPDLLEAHFRAAKIKVDKQKLAVECAEVEHQPSHASNSEILARKLRDLIGYFGERKSARGWLEKQVADYAQSLRAFNQKLDVRDNKGAGTVRRQSVHDALDGWITNWSPAKPAFIVSGDEGVGKTWVCVDWLLERQAKDEDFPLCAIVTSNLVESGARPLQLIAWALERCSSASHQHLSRRIETWVRRGERPPILILLLDGLNERPSFDWNTVLSEISDAPWRDRVAVLISVREDFRARKLADLGDVLPHAQATVGGYSDSELEQALAGRGLKLADIPSAVQKLIRTPRLCDLVGTHFDRLIKSNDLTVERLVYEDWRDRKQRKRGTVLDDTVFREVLSDAAKEFRKGVERFTQKDIERLIPEVGQQTMAVVQELIDGGIFVPSGSASTPYIVERKKLVHALGLLLFDTLVERGSQRADLEEAVGEWTETYNGTDIKAEILGAAVFFAALEDRSPGEVRKVLLRAWLDERNLGAAGEEQAQQYFARMPELYLELAEELWGNNTTHTHGRSRIADAVVANTERPELRPKLVEAVWQWLGTVHLKGHPIYTHEEERSADVIQAALQSLTGRAPALGPIQQDGYRLWLRDNDKRFDLTRLGLIVISAGDRAPFLDAVLSLALASVVMNVHASQDDLLTWTLRLTDEDLYVPVESTLNRWATSGELIQRKAAHRVLRAIGSSRSYPQARLLGAELYPKDDAELVEDRCLDHWRWTPADCQTCMDRADVEAHVIARRLASYAIDPEFRISATFKSRLDALISGTKAERVERARYPTTDDFELEEIAATLEAFAPEQLASKLRELFRSAPERNSESLRSLAQRAAVEALVVGATEVEPIRTSRAGLLADSQGWNIEAQPKPDGMITELWLFTAELAALSADAQLSALLERPEQAYPSTDLLGWFKPVGDDRARELLSGLVDRSAYEQSQTLWFLRASRFAIDDAGRRALLALARSEDPRVRYHALVLAERTQDGDLLQAVSAMENLPTNGFEREPEVRSRIRAKAATRSEASSAALPLAERIYWAASRGWPADEAKVIATELHAEWTQWQQDAPGAGWSGSWDDLSWERVDLREILKARPDLMGTWADWLAPGLKRWPRLRFGSRFPRALIGAILELRPQLGAELWLKLNDTGVAHAQAALAVPESAESEWLRAFSLEPVFDDARLGFLARAAGVFRKHQWVTTTARGLLDAPCVWRRGRGLALAALADLTAEEFAPFAVAIEQDESWLKERRSDLVLWHNQNRWARHWFAEFLRRATHDGAWGAFRLFLRCVDRRFEVWSGDLIAEAGDPETNPTLAQRLRYYRTSNEVVKRAIKTREDPRKETFLGARVPRQSIYPFVNGTPDLICELEWER